MDCHEGCRWGYRNRCHGVAAMVVVKAIAKVIAKMPLFVAVHKEYTSAVFVTR